MMNLVKPTDAILHRPSKRLDDTFFENNGKALKPVAELLLREIAEKNAVGISACQIGIDLAVFAIITDNQPRVCANPEIVAAQAGLELGTEGCLTFPNLWLKVKRPTTIIVRYKNIDGVEVTEQLDDFPARAWLHEYDHLQGICFTNRVTKLSLDIAKRKQAKLNRRNQV